MNTQKINKSKYVIYFLISFLFLFIFAIQANAQTINNWVLDIPTFGDCVSTDIAYTENYTTIDVIAGAENMCFFVIAFQHQVEAGLWVIDWEGNTIGNSGINHQRVGWFSENTTRSLNSVFQKPTNFSRYQTSADVIYAEYPKIYVSALQNGHTNVKIYSLEVNGNVILGGYKENDSISLLGNVSSFTTGSDNNFLAQAGGALSGNVSQLFIIGAGLIATFFVFWLLNKVMKLFPNDQKKKKGKKGKKKGKIKKQKLNKDTKNAIKYLRYTNPEILKEAKKISKTKDDLNRDKNLFLLSVRKTKIKEDKKVDLNAVNWVAVANTLDKKAIKSKK